MCLKITPKLGEDINELKLINSFDYDSLEIQLLTYEIKKFKQIIESFIKEKNLNNLIVHLPSELCDWELIPVNKEIETDFFLFVRDCIDLGEKYNTNIKILGHLSMRYTIIKTIDLKSWFGRLIRMVSGTKVSFLIENAVCEPYKAKSGESFYLFVKELNNEKVRCCLDICHYNVAKFLYKDGYSLAEDIGEYVESVHFSSLPVKESIYEPRTHGRKHNNKEEILKELNLLQTLGINLEKIFLVTEINEEDYSKRPDLIYELELLYSL